MSYQDRKDIDALYDLIWDSELDKSKFATGDELKQALVKYYNKAECDELFATKSELENISFDVDTSDIMLSDDMITEISETLSEDYTTLEQFMEYVLYWISR